MWVDHSEEGKKLFFRVIQDASPEVDLLIRHILDDPRTKLSVDNINWDAVYQDILHLFPTYDTSATVRAASVDEALEDVAGLPHGSFSEYLNAIGADTNTLYHADELLNLLYKANIDMFWGLYDNEISDAVKYAFDYFS